MNHDWLNEGDFLSLIKAEFKLHKALLDAETKKREILVSGHWADLAPLNEEEHDLVEELSKLETKRNAFMSEAVKKFGLKTPTLEAISSQYSSETQQDLFLLKSSWQQVVFKLCELRRENQVLIASALNIVQVRLDAIKTGLSYHSYSESGESTSRQAYLVLNYSA